MEQENLNNIKTITPVLCPHCNKELMVEVVQKSPELKSVFTRDTANESKKIVLEQLKEKGVDTSDERYISFEKWLNDPETVFGPSEIELIIESFLRDNLLNE